MGDRRLEGISIAQAPIGTRTCTEGPGPTKEGKPQPKIRWLRIDMNRLGLPSNDPNMNSLYQKGPWVPGFIVFGLSGLVYSLTLAPTFLHIDCGELAAAQYTLGITHPTGYPLFTLLGYLFLKLPLFDRPILQSNVLAALCTAGGMGWFAAWLFQMLKTDFHLPDSKKKAAPGPPPCTAGEAFWISVSATLLLAFTLTVWAQATSTEVYSLHILVLSMLFWFAYQAWQKNTTRSWIWAALVLGLGFSNHMTTLMALPMLAFFYFHKNGIRQEAFSRLAILAITALSILVLMYGFLFYRAGMDPILNWGNIHDLTTLKRHITGHQYSSWILAGSKVAARNLGEFLKALPGEWAFAGVLLIVLGISSAFRSSRMLTWALTCSLLFNLFYVSQYDIKDLEPYYMQTIFGFAFYAAFGMKRLLIQLKKPAMAPVLLLFPLLALGLNFKASDQSKTRFFEEYTQSALKSIEPDALVITQQWDFLIPQYYYLRMVENQFPRLTVLDKELVRRSWYVNKQARLLDAQIFSGADAEKQTFLDQVKPFEERKPFNGELIEDAYQGLLSKVMTNQLKVRPVYIGLDCVQNEDLQIPEGYKLVPVGFWLKLVPVSSGYIPARIPMFKPVIPENWAGKGKTGYYSAFILDLWNTGCRSRAKYEADAGRSAEAQAWASAVL